MRECSKSMSRRLADSNFVRKYFVGNGIDIGGKPDPFELYKEFFPLMTGVRMWDWEDGDAEFMAGVADETFDFVFSSHCLEHIKNPHVGIANWLRVLKPNGHLIINVPEEDLYEQGVFPSTYNRDHKYTWTVFKERSWSEKSVNVFDLLSRLGAAADVRKVEVIDAGYRYNLPRFDQTLSPVSESAIEMIIRKRTAQELTDGGRIRRGEQPSENMRVHFNQYMDDQKTLRSNNVNSQPFLNKNKI
jgi:SAM-dependent methyltransferase